MLSLGDAVGLLRAKRKELSDQLDAVDKAIASEPVTTRLKSPRTLSDEHAHALREGGRRARHLKEAIAGRAREMPDPRPGLAPASSADGQRPRLVKQTESRNVMTGTIRTIRIDKGFGFIKDDGGKDYFFHQSAIYGEGLDNLREGDSVEFDLGEGPKGPRAENVRRTST